MISLAAWLRLQKSWAMDEPQFEGVGIVSDVSDGIAIIRLTSPETANALDPGDMTRLAATIDALTHDPRVRAMILTGSGRHFCAGASLNGLAGTKDRHDLAKAVGNDVRALQAAFDASPVVTIAAVNGAAAGAGAGIALMADIMLMAARSRLMFPFAQLGLIPDTGITFNLPHRIGAGRAKDVLMTGGSLSAEHCVEYGLASASHDDDMLLDEARNLAIRLAGMPDGTHAAIRNLIARTASVSMKATIEAEAEAQAIRFSAPETQQAINALAAKI